MASPLQELRGTVTENIRDADNYLRIMDHAVTHEKAQTAALMCIAGVATSFLRIAKHYISEDIRNAAKTTPST